VTCVCIYMPEARAYPRRDVLGKESKDICIYISRSYYRTSKSISYRKTKFMYNASVISQIEKSTKKKKKSSMPSKVSRRNSVQIHKGYRPEHCNRNAVEM